MRTFLRTIRLSSPSDRDLRRVVAKQQRAGGKRHRVRVGRNVKMDSRERARGKQRRPCCRRGVRPAAMRDFWSIACEVVTIVASNVRSGYSGSSSVAFMPSFSRSRIGFRHGNINPHLMNVGDREQRPRHRSSPP